MSNAAPGARSSEFWVPSWEPWAEPCRASVTVGLLVLGLVGFGDPVSEPGAGDENGEEAPDETRNRAVLIQHSAHEICRRDYDGHGSTEATGTQFSEHRASSRASNPPDTGRLGYVGVWCRIAFYLPRSTSRTDRSEQFIHKPVVFQPLFIYI